MTINGLQLTRYFGTMQRRLDVLAPMYATSTLGQWDTYATVRGGGTTGQAQVPFLLHRWQAHCAAACQAH